MVEWPQEVRRRSNNPAIVSPRLADIPDEVLREALATAASLSLVRAVVDGFNAGADAKVQRPELSARLQSDFAGYSENVREALLALACVEAFRQAPTREMWEFLWSLTWDSSSLPVLLEQAVIAASTEAAFRSSFLATAHDVVRHVLENPGRWIPPGKRNGGADQREYWRKHPQLSVLWRNSFRHGFDPFGRDDAHVLSITVQIDTVEFIRLLEVFDYPDLVANALTWCGAGWKFESWEAMVNAAPRAFDEEGRWNGSLILPLLLSIARDQFQFPLRKDATDEQVSEATAGIEKLALEVARVITPRADALSCTTRWGAWLIRTGISALSANATPHPSNAKSQGFTDFSLLDALINGIPADSWKPVPVSDAESWEPWCHLAVGVMVALSKKAPMPSPSGFLGDWELSPEGWYSKAGQTLKARAMPFEMGAPRADGYGSRLLAVSVIEPERADATWAKFWNSTAPLREIVEFGDVDENASVGWQGRSDASQLLMLQFSVGLMMLDHLILPQVALTYARRRVMEGLLPLLDEAVREMTAIDALNAKFWTEARRHLAVRRATWLSGHGLRQTSVEVIALDPEAKPTLADFVRDLAGDTEGLLNLVQTASLNHVEGHTLATAFKAAGVNLEAEVAIAKRLVDISPKAANFGQAQIDAASALLPLF